MIPRSRRWGLAAALGVLAAVSVLFYQRQNAGLNTGGPISAPKMLWLARALAAWFILPAFLAWDGRLDPGVRRLFKAFWVVMMARGVVELVLIYAVGHWNPLYGIAHNAFCILLIWVLCLRAAPRGVWDRRALRVAGSLLVSLTAEISFAGMFYLTGAHENGVYFASTEAAWGFINLVTILVLLFVIPDLAAALVTLYFPGVSRETPRVLRWGRRGGCVATACVALGALGFWTRMHLHEAEAKRFQETGYRIVDSCVRFKDDFTRGDEGAMADFVRGGEIAWRPAVVRHAHPFVLERWEAGGPTRSLLESLLEMRRAFVEVLQAAFKIHLLDETGEGWAVAQIRFEVTGRFAGGDGGGRSGTDAGLLRCRFERGTDGRWRATSGSLIERAVTRGSGSHFRDAARERGITFRMEADERFVPCGSCDGHACYGPSRLKFQTMRHAYAGCAAADYDGDGHDDVFFGAGGRSALFRNRGDGTFEEATRKAGLGEIWHVNTAGFADLDNDGDQDLFLGSFYGRNRLLANDGRGSFRDVTAGSGLGPEQAVTCFSFFDYDRDGDLDLYLGRFLDAATEIPDSFLYARNGEPDVLYRNEGGLRFTDVTALAGVGERGLALSVAAADWDSDGDQDLYVANDFGRNVLHSNRGDGTFADAAPGTRTLAIGGSMSASWGDYDNDGLLDLYVAAIRSNQRWFVQPITARRVVHKFIREGKLGPDNPVLSDLKSFMGDDWVNIGNHALSGNSLLRQSPDGTFTDVAEAAGARPAGWYWSSGFFDIDHDGDLDILATDGWITGKSSHDL